jgi:hypothetical protein
MNKYIFVICTFLALVSCKESTKETPQILEEKTETRNINNHLIFENKLVKKDIDNSEYSNILFKKEGAVFTRDNEKPTYIKIPFSSLDYSKEFNVSFTFKTTFGDGSKPQSLLAFVNNSSTTFQIPFYLYLPRKKISGVYGDQLLYYENYDKDNSESNVFKSSKEIGVDKNYFVSVNYTSENGIDIYVNSYLYATFNDLTPHELKSTHLIIGTMIQAGKPIIPFEGEIYGLKIYNKALLESEIVELFNSQPLFIEFL